MPVHGLPPRTSRERSRPRTRAPGRGLQAGSLALLVGVAAVSCATFAWIASRSTWNAMVRDDAGSRQARWVLVLDGWVPGGERASKGLALVRAGQADSVLISGSRVAPGLWASTFQIRAQSSASELKGRVAELRHGAHSTLEEARAATAFFRSRGTDTVLLVTSDYHSDRAASIFQRVAGGDPVFLAVPAIESRFSAGWDRERLKTWLLEETKRLVWFGWERWTTDPWQAGRPDSVEWSAALGDSAGTSPLFGSQCPAPVVCPPPVECPAPGAVVAEPEPPKAEPKPEPKPEPKAEPAKPRSSEKSDPKASSSTKDAKSAKSGTKAESTTRKAEPAKSTKKTSETKSSSKR